MTIYGTGYRPLDVPLVGRVKRLLPLFWREYGSLFRTRMGVLAFIVSIATSIFSLGVLLVRTGVLHFVEERVPRGEHLPTPPGRLNPEAVAFYMDPIVVEGVLQMLILTGLVACRAIAKDRATNALELYWTRGISPLGYFLAKWFGSAALMGSAMVLPSLVLWVAGVFLAEDWSFFEKTVGFMPGALAGLVLFTLLLSYLSVVMSALSSSANLASVLWCMLIIGSSGVGHTIMGDLFRSPRSIGSVSVWDAAATLAQCCAGMEHPYGTVSGALTLLGIVTVVLTVLMRRRLRLREAVA